MWAFDKQKRRIWPAVIAILQVMTWVSATRIAFAPYEGALQQGQSPQATLNSRQGIKSIEIVMNKEAYKEALGSRPPSCEHKCGGCIPCKAMQIPTTTDHLGIQYANYEPEEWKCKCGTSFFNP